MILDHPAWVALQQGVTSAIINNLPEWLIGLGAVSIAAVCMMPQNRPKTLDDWWSWFRNTLQTAVPAARAAHSSSESITSISDKVAVESKKEST